jgi:putative SERF-like protein
VQLTSYVGGNAREIARAKNQKKQAEMNKGKNNESGLTLAQRRERDAAALRAKQEAAAAKKGTQNG